MTAPTEVSLRFLASLPPTIKMELLRKHAASVSARADRLFKPLPWQVAPYEDRTSRVMLLTGSAGGGKSKLAAHKLHWQCLNFPGSMVVGVRKTRESMTNSTVLFLEDSVIKGAAKLREGKHRFEYPNGSIFAYGGMRDKEQRQQIRSIGREGGLDGIWMEEANAFVESDFNELLPRLRANAGPYRQLILSTNPDSPMHWIYTKLIIGKRATVYYSKASDNTYNPDDYEETLGMVTGVDKQRLVEGIWAQASGLIYDNWSELEGGNVTDEADYVPGVGSLVWAIDDGYAGEVDDNTGFFSATSHPRCFLLCQILPNGLVNVVAEHYKLKTQPEDHIAQVLEMPYPPPEWAVVDKSAASLKGRLHTSGINTRSGAASVDESIKELRRQLAADTNGVRRIRVHPRCEMLRKEMVAYVWDTGSDTPLKQFDHGPDALRYFAWAVRFD
jgi:phage terminase large subunit